MNKRKKMTTRDFKQLYNRYCSIQRKKYFDTVGKDTFDDETESRVIEEVIRQGWDEYIETKKEKLLTMKERDIVNFFEAIDLAFPEDARKNESADLHSDPEYVGLDDSDGLDELFDEEFDSEEDDEMSRELEMLSEELDQLSDELNSIPEEEREDVIMLMLAFPALQETGFPINAFLGGDGSVQLTDLQRTQIDWARQLAYKIVDFVEEPDEGMKKTMYEDIRRFAMEFVPPSKVESVIQEIQEAYERGRQLW